MAYPKDFLETRAIIKHGVYAVIPPEGRVINVVPGFEGFSMTILASPKLGASFVQYVATVAPGAKTTQTFGGNGIETFVYVLDGDGTITVTVGDESFDLTQGGYVYAPADQGMDIRNESGEDCRIFLYKQKYQPLAGYEARTVSGNVNDIEERIYEDMENVFIKDLLPTDLGFDVNMHILSFEPSGCHPFVETHVQEHGAYIYEGQGMYLLGEDWVQVKKEDYLFFGPYTQQGVYATGRGRLTYIYSKDFNRDVEL